MCVKCFLDGELPGGRKVIYLRYKVRIPLLRIDVTSYVSSIKDCKGGRFMSFLEKFRSSSKELKSIENLIICALLMAITLVISSFSIVIGDYIKIGFSFIASELAYLLFGPVVGAIFGGTVDILAYIVKPTGPYFFGFTLSAILSGLIYGMFLYKKPISIWRILLVKAIVAVLINMLLGTYWLSLMYGKGFLVLFPLRAIKNLVMLPINSILFYTVAKMLEQTKMIRVQGIKSRR